MGIFKKIRDYFEFKVTTANGSDAVKIIDNNGVNTLNFKDDGTIETFTPDSYSVEKKTYILPAVASQTYTNMNYVWGVRNLLSDVSSYRNIAIGGDALRDVTTQNDNIAFGNLAGLATTGNGSVFIGYKAGTSSVLGAAVCIGYEAGQGSSQRKVAIGYQSNKLGTGAYCTTVGYTSGGALTTGGYNTLVGHSAGGSLQAGAYNSCFGSNSGNSSISNNYGVFLGYNAGYYETGSNKLFISSLSAAQQVDEATARTKAIVYGEQDTTTANQVLQINGKEIIRNGTNNNSDGFIVKNSSDVEVLKVTDLGVLKQSGITTTVRDTLTPSAGDIIYNTTDNKHQGYDGSTWNNLY